MTPSNVAARIPLLVLTLSVVLSACGDPRAGFVGTWKGPLSTAVRFSDGSTQTYPKGEVSIVITAPERSNQLTLGGRCALTATPNDDRTFSINRKACASERVTLDDGTTCELVETVNGGAGNLTASALTMSWFGDSQVVRCSDGLSVSATYTSQATLSH